MVELEATTQKNNETVPRWKYAVPTRPVTLGRVADQSEWAVPWDDTVSRKHAALQWEPELGQLLVVDPALADVGTSQALGGHDRLARVRAPGGLTDALRADSGPPAAVVSADLFYGGDDRVPSWIAAGAVAVAMDAATVFAVATRYGVEAGCALLVSDIVASKQRIDADALHVAELELGRLAISSFR